MLEILKTKAQKSRNNIFEPSQILQGLTLVAHGGDTVIS